jgi:hypothetical protein
MRKPGKILSTDGYFRTGTSVALIDYPGRCKEIADVTIINHWLSNRLALWEGPP